MSVRERGDADDFTKTNAAPRGRGDDERVKRRGPFAAFAVTAMAAGALATASGCRDVVSLGDPAARADGEPIVDVHHDAAGPDATEDDWDDGPEPPPFTPTRVDLLFVVDDSEGMGGARELFRSSALAIVDRLVRPHCVTDDAPRVLGRRPTAIAPSGGSAAPVRDLHVGVVTTSLGRAGRPLRAAGGGRAGAPARPAGAPAAPGLEHRRISEPLVAALDATLGAPGARLRLRSDARRLVPLPRPARSLRRGRAVTGEAEGVDAEVLRQRRGFCGPTRSFSWSS